MHSDLGGLSQREHTVERAILWLSGFEVVCKAAASIVEIVLLHAH